MRARNMMKRLMISAVVMVGVLTSSAAMAVASPASARALSPDPAACNQYFITLPAWYNGLAAKNGGSCTVVSPTDMKKGADDTQFVSRFIWIIALNVLQILFQLVAYLSVGFTMYGGFVYLTSAGRSDKISRGREMIQNAIIGLIISLLAIGLVAFVGGQIGVS